MNKACLALAACLFLLTGSIGAQTLTKDADGIFISKEQQGKIAMSPEQVLVVNAASTLSGELYIRAGGSDCHYRYTKLLKTPTKTEAARFADAIKVEIEKQKDDVVLMLRAPARVPWSGTNNSGRLKIIVEIPENSRVEINTAYFDVNVIGPLTGLTISESLSKVEVERINGPVDIRVSNRPLVIRGIAGELTAVNKYDRIELENIDTGGKLADISNEHGEIIIDGFRGQIDVRTSYDRIEARNLFLTGTDNRVKNISNLISLSFDSITIGDLRVNNSYENIEVDIEGMTDAEFICKMSDKGTITADRLNLSPLFVDESRLEFLVGEGAAEIRLTARGGGDIHITGSDDTAVRGER